MAAAFDQFVLLNRVGDSYSVVSTASILLKSSQLASRVLIKLLIAEDSTLTTPASQSCQSVQYLLLENPPLIFFLEREWPHFYNVQFLPRSGQMAKMRSEIAEGDKWDVQSFYPSFEAWEKEFAKIKGESSAPRWPALAAFRGELGKGPARLKELLEAFFALDRSVGKVATYAHLRHDENLTDDQFKSSFQKAMSLNHDLLQEAAWIEPELLALPEEKLNQYLRDPLLADYRFYLEKIVRMKKHTRSAQEEELIAMAAKPLSALHKSFSVLENADFRFGTIRDQDGKTHELTHGSFQLYLRSPDRTLRANAFKGLHKQFIDYENTLCELLQGEMQTHWFYARSHNFNSCLEAALYPKQVDPSVYRALIESVRSQIGSLHRYMNLRKRVMKLPELRLYDMYIPLVEQQEREVAYDEAEQMVIGAMAPLGKEYSELLKKGLEKDRWVDRYENLNKRSGAYSSGCFDSHPYILLNFKGILHDAFTLAHEAGHSMHTLLSNSNQLYHNSQYPIFLAEVASTFNEDLLMRKMQQQAKEGKERAYLINQKIDDIRATLFRQTMFAEFELYLHELVEQDVPLTPSLLKKKYRELNEFYFGPEVVLDDEVDIEWARIPHFYYNFYVYQYATGISAALALAEKVVKEGEKARDSYLNFLKGGGSRYPLDQLKTAGVDMATPEPILGAIAVFDGLVKELEALL